MFTKYFFQGWCNTIFWHTRIETQVLTTVPWALRITPQCWDAWNDEIFGTILGGKSVAGHLPVEQMHLSTGGLFSLLQGCKRKITRKSELSAFVEGITYPTTVSSEVSWGCLFNVLKKIEDTNRYNLVRPHSKWIWSLSLLDKTKVCFSSHAGRFTRILLD